MHGCEGEFPLHFQLIDISHSVGGLFNSILLEGGTDGALTCSKQEIVLRVKVLNALTDPQKQLTGSFVSMEYCTQVITTLEQIMK